MYNAETVNEFVPSDAHIEWGDLLDKHGDKKVVETFYGYDYWHFDDVIVTEIAPQPVLDVGACDGTAQRTIDADGAIVTPGFIDLHTHYDG